MVENPAWNIASSKHGISVGLENRLSWIAVGWRDHQQQDQQKSPHAFAKWNVLGLAEHICICNFTNFWSNTASETNMACRPCLCGSMPPMYIYIYIYVSVTTDHFRIIIRISNDFGQFHPSPCLHPIAVLCTWLGQTRFWPMHCIGSETGLDILVCVKWSFGCCGCCGNDNFCGHLATAGPRNIFLSRWHVICAVLHCALSRRDCYLPSQTERKHKPNFASKQFTPSSAMKNIAFIRL